MEAFLRWLENPDPLLAFLLFVLFVLLHGYVSYKGRHDPSMTMTCLDCDAKFPKRDAVFHECAQEAT